MKFRCDNRYCRDDDPTSKRYNEPFRFKAKPTVDERSECPKCGRWCSKSGHSGKDKEIRDIDLLLMKHGHEPLSEWNYRHLSNYRLDRLKELIVEVKLSLGVVG